MNDTPEERWILLRLSGEVTTKAKTTRRHFVARLVRNVKETLSAAGIRARVERHYERVLVATSDGPAAVEALRCVFGLQSLALTETIAAERLEDIVETGERVFRDAVAGKRFAVRARRVGNHHPVGIRSRDIEFALGEILLRHASKVDLGNPEVTAHVELYEGNAHLFWDNTPASGGLPIGTGGGAVTLVSGGFDSAVAAWQLHRRGVTQDYVFCNLGGRTHQAGTVRVMHELARRWCGGSRPHLHAIDFAEVTLDLQRNTDPRLWQVLLKRLMLRAAEAVAIERQADAIITGEAVGQVSSQTLVNLRTISAATDLPILRPLVGMNKDEIVQTANRIGTGPLSAVVDEYCALTTRNPATRTAISAVEAEETRLDPALLADAIARREVLNLRRIDPDDMGLPEIEIHEVPDGALVLDVRTRTDHAGWHPDGAVHLDWNEALQAYPSFGKDRAYVVFCEFGLKSAHLAEMMRAAGLEAFHFKGGTRALRAWIEKNPRPVA